MIELEDVDSIVKRDWEFLKSRCRYLGEWLLFALFVIGAFVPYVLGVYALFVFDSWWMGIVGMAGSFAVLIPVAWVVAQLD